MASAKLYAILAALLITGCASNPKPPDILLVPVPSELTAPIPEPRLEGDQNKDLVSLIDALRAALQLANDRLRSIGAIGD